MTKHNKPKRSPGRTPEEEEQICISLAFAQARNMLEKQEASSQIVAHFLKAGSTRNEVEKAKIEYETKLLEARIEESKQAQITSELINQALVALESYRMPTDGYTDEKLYRDDDDTDF